MAIDAEPTIAARFASGLGFPTLVDPGGALARALRFRAIPNGFAFTSQGALIGEKLGGFDIREGETVSLLASWLSRSPLAATEASRATGDASTALAQQLFAAGMELRRRGERERALAAWHAAHLRDPRSLVIRKQIWRALYPERFGDPIDMAWQEEQIGREDRMGFGAANPALPPADERAHV